MANKSLTATPSSNNDISSLADVLENNFQYNRKSQSRCKIEYIDSLKTVVGLGFTAVMVDRLYILMHQSDFNRFLDYFNTASPQNSIKPVSLEAARILNTAALAFRSRREGLCSEYYSAFKKMLEQTVKSGLMDSSENTNESSRLLRLMIRERYY